MSPTPLIERAQLLATAGWVHGFTTRCGGVSQGGFASLNMGGKWGDDPEAVSTNRALVARAARFDPGVLRLVHQVHGNDVVRVGDSTTRADALWCHRDDAPVVVAVMTADCVPVLLADQEKTVACAIHSGWRGTVANIAGAVVRTVTARAHLAPSQLLAAIGPCIGRAAFEVGAEVAEQFPHAVVDRTLGPRPHVDLRAMVQSQLEAAGVAAANVEQVGGCTFSAPARYFSYRRDGAGIGQMIAFIGFAEALG